MEQEKNILNEFPITNKIVEKYLNDKMKEYAIILRDHYVQDNLALSMFFEMIGVDRNDILVIDKGDSTLDRVKIKNKLKQIGYHTMLFDNYLINNSNYIKEKEELVDFIKKREDKKVIILDDGGLIGKVLRNEKLNNIYAVVELTEMGLRRLKKIDEIWKYPIYNVAKTKVKRKITYKEIGLSVYYKIIELLRNEKFSGRDIIIIGYGDLGKRIADIFKNINVKVSVVDTDMLQLIVAAEDGYRTFRKVSEALKNISPFMIIGATGNISISKEDLKLLKKDTYITAAATADQTVFKNLEEYKLEVIPKYGSIYKFNNNIITHLGNGRSINLFYSESLANKNIDLFKAIILLTVIKITEIKIEHTGIIDVGIVDDWIEKSGILEEYYKLYFEC